MSFTVVLLPILSVLSIAHNNYLKPGQMWWTINEEQQFFTDTYWPFAHQLSKLTEKELSSIISPEIDEVNRFLKDKGFDIQLDPFENSDPGNCAIASVLDVLLKWKVPGTEHILTVENEQYPAVFMPTNESCMVGTYKNQEVAVIEAENNDTVYLMKAPLGQPVLKDFALIEYLKNISKKNLARDFYEDMLFPMVDINEQLQLNWLLDLRFPIDDSREYRISQALQQTKFQMNEQGTAVQSAVVISIVRTCVPRHFIIDEPFYIWIKRDGIDIPVFAAYVDKENWKKPAKLGN